MRLKTPLVALSSVGLLALAACGSGSSGTPTSNPPVKGGDTGNGQDATAKGPVTISGAQKGGIVTVLTLTGLSTTIDPSEIYYTDTSSIMSGLVTRSLTQYKYDPVKKQMILVPDLATNLGTPNDSFTKWTFPIRTGVKWEDGSPVTPKEIAWGMQRCMDAATFPTGPCQYYSNVYFKGGSTYKGPYTDPGQKFTSVKAVGNKIVIKMDKPFPDMPYWGTFPANGPIPLGKSASDPKTYKNHPMSTGPYMIKSFSPSKELVLTRNPNWDASTDPARTQYPDGYDFKMQQQSEKIDQILLADSGSGQSTLTYDNLLAPDFAKMQTTAPDRLTLGGTPCTYYWAPDNRQITSKKVREALSWAYPYKNNILAAGLIPGVTAIPASNLMPPGLPGRTPYNVTGRKGFQTDAAKARELLKSANALGFEIKFLFRTDDPISVKTKDSTVKALTQAGFKATPVPTTTADYVAARDNTTEDINVRSAGWCSDWPSGSTWLPTLFASTNPDTTKSFGSNYSAFSNKSVDSRMNAIQHLPLDQQAAAWNSLDKQIATKYFPLFTTYYTGIAQAHGSKINGDYDDTTLGMPTWKSIWVSP
ncbi:ABC transporter substrate-binding protein [Nocardioides cynanchi]|uniref:ABC transporter substrate-binding protein n=1 Tax=Nocardioides cynanchi TaxID=2558918 RepID=UPI0012465862|nr:ABC transporter substrate-binding protein [Nocardioides cynanchi]